MPFDAAGTDPYRDEPLGQQAVLMVHWLQEFFAGGARWMSGVFHDGNYTWLRRRCLLSAMAHLRTKRQMSGDRTGHYLRRAIPEVTPALPADAYRHTWVLIDGPRGEACVNKAPVRDGIQTFNDSCKSYEPVAAVLARAQELALADMDRARQWEKPGLTAQPVYSVSGRE